MIDWLIDYKDTSDNTKAASGVTEGFGSTHKLYFLLGSSNTSCQTFCTAFPCRCNSEVSPLHRHKQHPRMKCQPFLVHQHIPGLVGETENLISLHASAQKHNSSPLWTAVERKEDAVHCRGEWQHMCSHAYQLIWFDLIWKTFFFPLF